ncbi:MAG: hypothetical protein GXO60_09255 [Epsilonproteobacteria bacterium]|nr:hypothetical protein [Campylobacterota bacterium]
MMLKHFKILIFLLLPILVLNAKTVIEDAEDNSTSKWQIVQGEIGDIVNIYDSELDSRVIELNGGGSYKIGATGGEKALNIRDDKFISWKMKTSVAYTIYIIADTTDGLRYIFYVSTPSRGLRHGLPNGVHHGLGKTTIDGRWRTITRDLESDLKDAEPDNNLIAINGFIYNGGNNGRLDDIVLYTPQEIVYQDDEVRVDNSYKLDINNSKFKILQWSFKGFGGEPEVIERGTIRDPDAFEFRVKVDTANGERDLVYTLGEYNLGLIEGGKTIHHGLGDDRTIGSVWVGDDPLNELGLWQRVTRNLEEDIKDFEHNNSLISVKSFEVKNSGLIDNIKMFSSVDTNLSENLEDMPIRYPDEDNITSDKNSDSVGVGKMFSIFSLLYMFLIISIFLSVKKIKKL